MLGAFYVFWHALTEGIESSAWRFSEQGRLENLMWYHGQVLSFIWLLIFAECNYLVNPWCNIQILFGECLWCHFTKDVKLLFNLWDVLMRTFKMNDTCDIMSLKVLVISFDMFYWCPWSYHVKMLWKMISGKLWIHVYDNTSDFIRYWCIMLRLAVNLSFEFADH